MSKGDTFFTIFSVLHIIYNEFYLNKKKDFHDNTNLFCVFTEKAPIFATNFLCFCEKNNLCFCVCVMDAPSCKKCENFVI